MRLKALKIGMLTVPVDNIRWSLAVAPSPNDPDPTHWYLTAVLKDGVTCPTCAARHGNVEMHWDGDGAEQACRRFQRLLDRSMRTAA